MIGYAALEATFGYLSRCQSKSIILELPFYISEIQVRNMLKALDTLFCQESRCKTATKR